MSESDDSSRSSSPVDGAPINITVVVEMMHYETAAANTRGKTPKPKATRKNKDFQGSIVQGKDGWLGFLKAVLECHNVTLKLSERHPFGIKVAIPPSAKTRSVVDLFSMVSLLYNCAMFYSGQKLPISTPSRNGTKWLFKFVLLAGRPKRFLFSPT